MNTFYVVTNIAKDPTNEVTEGIAEYLRAHGATCMIGSNQSGVNAKHRHTDPSDIPEGVECIIVLGGDGTLMRVADDVHERKIPLLGINLGTLGYLAEIDRSTIYPALDSLMNDQYQIEHRMMLYGAVYHEGERVSEGTALNDIVIGHEGAPHVMALYNYVNDAYLNNYRGDGVIISSPTGSTGYSLSAGGPLISPEANLFLMTPLAAHTLNTRSIVLPSENKITVRVGAGRDDTIEHAMAFFDGDRSVPMETGDCIEIQRSKNDTLIVKIHNDSFLETLRRKMSTI